MGLDMYLEADVFVGGNYESREVSGEVKLMIGGNPIILNPKDISSITLHVGYWRKANAVHRWFVENVQGGKDECQRSYVSLDQLIELRGLVQAALDAGIEGAEEVLPPQSGFFFGSTDINEYYMSDLKDTLDIIDKASQLPSDYSFYYQASW